MVSVQAQLTEDLIQLMPEGVSALDIGARDGFFSRILSERFERVVALDLEPPAFHYERVAALIGDVTNLSFNDRQFDFAFCGEVLEHVPALEKACSEIARVARKGILIGVPYKQDIRVGRTSCPKCGLISPPWGHVNTFDEARLRSLFTGWKLARKSFVGTNHETTTAMAAWMMDRAGNPWGSYNQIENCARCGSPVIAPAQRSLGSRVLSGVAGRLNRLQERFTQPHANWIHVLFTRAGD